MAKQKGLPNQVYVKWEDLGGEEPYLSVYEDINDCADKDKKVVVGTYKLVEVEEVSLEIKRNVKRKKV